MAAIQSLVNQKTAARQGNPNPIYYQLAATEYGSSGNANCNSTLGNGVASSCNFYDVTLGDMDVNCTGTNNCYLPSGVNGVLSTSSSSYLPAYGTATGWDSATGIGTINAANLVNNWPSSSQPNFTLSASPSSLTMALNSSDTSTITVTSLNGFNGSVSLSASGLPSGVTASFNPITTTTTSVLTLTASATAQTGTAAVTITGVSGSLTQTTSVFITVSAPSFSIGGNPASLAVTAGGTATSTLTVTSANGFVGTVTFTCAGAPSEAACSFQPPTVTPSADGTAATTLTVTTTAASILTIPGASPRPQAPLLVLTIGLMGLITLGLSLKMFLATGWKMRWATAAGIVVLGAVGMSSCGGGGSGGSTGNSGTPPGNYQIVVTAASTGTTTQVLTLPLTVSAAAFKAK